MISGGVLTNMFKTPEDFFSYMKTKKTAVIGLGVSHTDLIDLFLKKGIDTTLVDRKDISSLGETAQEFKKLGLKFDLGENYLENLSNYDVVFRTPGMYFNNPKLQQARKNGVIVTSEIEVFFEICPCKIYAVTGSDGKTTTTTLISEFLKAEGKTVHIGGNIGKPLLSRVEQIKKDDVCVVELSSFQLISMRQSPDVAVITNIAPNHLDVHKDMQEYIDSKKNILLHQNSFSKAVLNCDNELTYALRDMVRGNLLCFSRKIQPENGAFLDTEGNLCMSLNNQREILFNKSQIRIPGIHNVENYLTAIAATLGEVSVENIKKVANNFAGVEHRIEFVREFKGVKYYNDSIASSPTRTIAGLNSFDQKIIVIAGGYDKKIPYEPLAPVLCKKAKAVILLGATGPKIEKALLDCEDYSEDNPTIIKAQNLEEAVNKAAEYAKEGDIVSLSPASASFDLYKNFEERGKHFKNIVNALI